MFDRFVVVDWSASSTPKRGRDSIWIASHTDTDRAVLNPSTRGEAERLLVELIGTARTERTLLAVDFSLGYPVGTAASAGFVGPAWEATAAYLAAAVVESGRNVNNRFAVASDINARMTGAPSPFWGCPPRSACATLTRTKPVGEPPVPEWRIVEQRLRACGHRPFSAWQLLGAGAVGSQSLVGIPMIIRLHERFTGRVEVWPLTTGSDVPTVDAGGVVVVEVWPSLRRVVPRADEVRDAAQVRAVAAWLHSTDRADRLAPLFAPALSPAEVEAVEREEGWVLGVMS